MTVKARAQITLACVTDVKACYRYYLLQSSTLSKPSAPTSYPPSGNWNDVQPGYEQGSTNSLYIVDVTLFSDDSYLYSQVSLSSSYEAAKQAYNKALHAQQDVDNLQIGGRNLWRNSTFDNQFNGYDPELNGGTIEVQQDALNGHNAVVLSRSGYDGTDMCYIATSTYPSYHSYNAQDTFILSAWIYVQDVLDSNSSDIIVRGTAGDKPAITIPSSTQVGKWMKLISTPFTATTNGQFQNCCVRLGKNGKIKVSQIKLEKGNKPTDWTPAPQDVDGAISDATASVKSDVSAIIDQKQGIIMQAVEQRVTSDQLSAYKEQVSSQFQQTSSQITAQFTQTKQRIDSIEQDVRSNYEQISKYFRFSADGLIIGQTGNEITLRIDNDRISFLDGGIQVAYISNKQLTITQASFLSSLRVGKFAWMPRKSGNLSLVKVGD